MTVNRVRLAGWALIVGTVISTVGYLLANALATGAGDAKYTDPKWALFNGIAIGGDIVAVLGLPAILAAHGRRAVRLTNIGYVGIFAALVMLNISEGCVEAFIKPYLVNHGGIPANTPFGFNVFETIALVVLLVGLICLGIAVLRAKVFPWFVGVLFIVSPFVAFVGLPGGWALVSDYLAFAALFTVGLLVVRRASTVVTEAEPVALVAA